MFMAAFFVLKGSYPFSMLPKGRVTAAFSPNRRRRDWFPAVLKAGVLGILPGTVGAMQATEAIKYILGIGESMVGRLLLYDALNMEFTEVQLAQKSQLPGLQRKSNVD